MKTHRPRAEPISDPAASMLPFALGCFQVLMNQQVICYRRFRFLFEAPCAWAIGKSGGRDLFPIRKATRHKTRSRLDTTRYAVNDIASMMARTVKTSTRLRYVLSSCLFCDRLVNWRQILFLYNLAEDNQKHDCQERSHGKNHKD